MPRPDYPAAHSMDTTWFAVDADGAVARFDSGESGSVPSAADPEVDWFVLDAIGLAHLADDPATFAALLARRPFEVGGEAPRPDAHVAVVLHSSAEPSHIGGNPDGRPPALDAALFVQLRTEPPVFASTGAVSSALQAELERRPEVRRLITSMDLSESFDWELGGPAATFWYAHDGGAPGEYVKRIMTPSPVHLAELPGDVQRQLQQIAPMAIRFATTGAIRLADHFADDECMHWGERASLRGETGERPPTSSPVSWAATRTRGNSRRWLWATVAIVVAGAVAWLRR